MITQRGGGIQIRFRVRVSWARVSLICTSCMSNRVLNSLASGCVTGLITSRSILEKSIPN